MKEDNLIWKKVSTEHIVNDEWIDFRKESYIFPDGREYGPFYNITRQDFVVIVARNSENEYICVRQYRPGIEKVTCEFPAGGIEKGEDPFESAKRELLEETGHKSDNWRFLIKIPAYATICDNYFYVYAADDCSLVDNQNLDDTEFLNIEYIKEDYLVEMIYNDEFQQANHVMSYYIAKEK